MNPTKLEKNRAKGERYLQDLSWGFGPSIYVEHRVKYLLRQLFLLVGLFSAAAITNIFNIYFLTVIFVIATLFIGLTGIILHFLGLWYQELFLKYKVIMYPGSYARGKIEYAATAYNIGEETAIRELGLIIGWFEFIPGLSGLRKRLEGFTPHKVKAISYLMLTRGCFPLAKGAILPIPEKLIRVNLQSYLENLKLHENEILKENPNVYLVMFDRSRGSELSAKHPFITGLISACKIGSLKELHRMISEKKKINILGELLVSRIPSKTTDWKMGERRKLIFMRGIPPMVTTEERILNQLESIEKEIKKLGKISGGKAKARR